MSTSQYIIRGGIEGRERLRILARVMESTTLNLLDRIGIIEGMTCLDIGCGGGDVTRQLARRVGSTGKAIGTDIDQTTLSLAQQETQEQEFENVAFWLPTSTNRKPIRSSMWYMRGFCLPI